MSVLSELGFLALRNLSTILDYDSSQQRNWLGLAGKMELSYATVARLREDRSSSPTVALLKEWQEKQGGGATLQLLGQMLEELGCAEAAEIVREAQAKTLRLSNVSEGVKSTKEDGQLQGKGSTANSKSASASKERGGVAKSRKFDVFLSYAEEDEDFAEEVRTRLVRENLRVFIPSEGFMSGKVFHEEIAVTIKRDCWHTLVLLSPQFLSSPWCTYEANLSILKSPDTALNTLVPVLYRPCEVPPFMTHLHCLNYSNYRDNEAKCERLFWRKLILALSQTPSSV